MEPENTRVVVVFGARIHATNVDRLQPVVEPYLKTDNPREIVIDLAHVRVCDSCGLRLLINLQRKAVSMNKKLILCRPDNTLRDILQRTKLSHIFTVIESPDDPVPPHTMGDTVGDTPADS